MTLSASDTLQKLAAVVRHVSSRADVEAAAALAGDASLSAVIMDAADWQSIPAENLVAAFQVQLSSAFPLHLRNHAHAARMDHALIR